MPIIINEIEVLVEVTPSQSQGTQGGSGEQLNAEDIVRECVEKVMEILNQKKER